MKRINRKVSLTAQIIRVAWLSWGVVVGGFFLYNYNLSTQTFEAELERNFKQASQVIKQLTETQIQSLQITQDITSKSQTLIDSLVSRDFKALENFMLDLEDVTPNSNPDIRFISEYDQLTWEDGSGAFYGLTHQQIDALSQQVDYNNSWSFFVPSTSLGDRHIMLRRSPLVNPTSGEVLGYYFIGLVLDDNLSLIRNARADANIQEITLMHEDVVIASSLMEESQGSRLQNGYFDSQMVNEVVLSIQGLNTPIKAVFVQNNDSLEVVERSLATSLVLALIAVTLIAAWITWLIQKRVENAMQGVMSLVDSFDSNSQDFTFIGSDILEFDRLGLTLQESIRREREKETSFKNLFEFSLLPTILMNENKHVLEVNPAAKSAFSGDQNLLELRVLLSSALDESLQSQQHSEVNIKVGGVDYRWSISPIILEGVEPSLVLQGQNISQFVEVERQSERARQEAEHTAAARAEFLAKVSHEIRTPLNGIMGIAQILQRDAVSNEQKAHISRLYQSSEHLLNLLNDILDFSKIDKGLLILEKSEFSLGQVIETVTTFAEPSCSQKGLAFYVTQHFDDLMVSSDQVRLTQVFLNLITNAIKFTESGSVKVEVQLRNRLADNAELYFSVTDTGIGIAKEKQKAIFSSFTQAESHISRDFGGSGLGLSIVESLVSSFNGKIEVESELGKGSCFTVTMPIDIVTTSVKLPAVLEDKVELFYQDLNILLVEDNKTNAYVIQALVKGHGIHFNWVTDGQQAIDALKLHRYDLIIMDNQMPILDGIDATKLIRQNLNLTTPIIACTADGYENTANAFIEAGANAVLVKPIIEQDLLQTIQQVMEEAHNSKGLHED